MQNYRSSRLKKADKTERKHKRLALQQNQRITGYRIYRGILLSGAQYDNVLQASVKACIADFEAATKEECDAFIKAGGGTVILSSFGRMLLFYGTDPLAAEVLERYPDFFGALQFFTRIAQNRMKKDFLQPITTKAGGEAVICSSDVKTLSSDLAWTDGVFEGAILRAAFWYDAPRTARVWINALSSERIAKQLDKETQELAAQILARGGTIPEGEAEITDEEIEQILEERAQLLQIPRYKEEPEEAEQPKDTEQRSDTPKEPDARAKTQFGTREETALFPERGTKWQREKAGIRSTALTNIAVIASPIAKEPKLWTITEAFENAAFLDGGEDVLPKRLKDDDIPPEIYDYYSVVQTGIIDDIKAGGDGHFYVDMHAFCKTLGIPLNSRSLPAILKAFERLNRIVPDFGDDKIRMNAIQVTIDKKTGAIDFFGTSINEIVNKVIKHNTEVLKDPGKEFAPKNLKATLLRQKDVDAKNAIRQVIAPGFEQRGLYNPGKGKTIDYSVSYRKIINETDGFFAAYTEALNKSKGYASRFLQRKLDNIVLYLNNHTEYPTRYNAFQVTVVQPNKAGGSTILDSVIHLTHAGLADPADGQGDAGAGAKHSAEAEP